MRKMVFIFFFFYSRAKLKQKRERQTDRKIDRKKKLRERERTVQSRRYPGGHWNWSVACYLGNGLAAYLTVVNLLFF